MIPEFITSGLLNAITGRAAMAGLTAFFACVLVGPRVIAWLRSHKLGEKTEKGDSKVLDKMMKGKSETPTMGGLFLLASILIAVALFGSFKSRTLPILVASVAALGALGCVDDWLK